MDSRQKFIFIVVLFGGIIFMHAQQPQISTPKQGSEFIIRGFSYPDFGDGSRYASFSIQYQLTNSTEISVFGHHYKNMVAERFQIPIQIKQYLNEDFYVIGGYEQEWDLRNQNKGVPNSKPLQSIFYGMGYDVKPGLSVEGLLQHTINSPDFSPLGMGHGFPVYKVRTKFKF